MQDDNKAHSRFWNVIQSIISGLLVTAIVGLVIDRFDSGRDMERHRLLIDQLVNWKNQGDRFTARDGSKMMEHFENEIARLEIGCRDRSDKALANDVRQWDAHRKHIELDAHKGAEYRINTLDQMVRECCRLQRRNNFNPP